MKYLFVLLFFCGARSSFSQTIISGKIINNQGRPVAVANVVITNKDQLAVLAFSISDNKGVYRIAYNGIQDSIVIKLSSIGYSNVVQTIANKSQVLNFQPDEKITALPTVEVKTTPISIHGDSVDYKVEYFAKNADRSVGDVIGRLPGFQVDENGGIRYNGKAISNYYINGMDLLETRYGIANNNIPHNLVDKVQLLDNHQPIKILDSLSNSTTPAVNIILKKNAANKFIGNAKLGLGFSPVITDDEVTAMQFNKNFQFITAYKYNNIGKALSKEITQQVSIQSLDELPQEKKQEDILSVVSLPNPQLSERRYRFNDNHLIHFSALKALENKAQVKFNLAYLKDFNQLSGSNFTTLFLPGDTVTLLENLRNIEREEVLSADFYYSFNEKNKYIRNALKLQFNFAGEKGLFEGSNSFDQYSRIPYSQVENEYQLVKPLGKKLVTIKSSTVFNTTAQHLTARPGSFPGIFNDSLPYTQVQQFADLLRFSSNNTAAFQTRIGKSIQEIGLGAEYQYKIFTSSITKTVNQNFIQLNDIFQNKLHWQNIRSYLNGSTVFDFNNKRLSIFIPIEVNSVIIRNSIKHFQLTKTMFSQTQHLTFLFLFLQKLQPSLI